MMTCLEMNLTQLTPGSVDFSRFEKLPKHPKTMLNDLFESAWKERELPPEQHSKPFLNAWSLLSYTAEVTTGLGSDKEWFPIIRADTAWSDRFNNVMDNPKSLMRMYTKRFAELWPIFDVSVLMGKGILQHQSATRDEAIVLYRSKDAGKYLPECWCRHMDEGSRPLPDWEHTLGSWFAVRRNLFKDPLWQNSENDPRIVSNAFLSLIYFFKEGRLYFENPSLKPDIFDRTQVLSSL
jgi:hypothetical protein